MPSLSKPCYEDMVKTTRIFTENGSRRDSAGAIVMHSLILYKYQMGQIQAQLFQLLQIVHIVLTHGIADVDT